MVSALKVAQKIVFVLMKIRDRTPFKIKHMQLYMEGLLFLACFATNNNHIKWISGTCKSHA